MFVSLRRHSGTIVVAAIVGATKLEHLEDALAAEELSLTEEQIARLEEPYVPHSVSGIDL